MTIEPIPRQTLLDRGFCCGSGCTNCPYDFMENKTPTRDELREGLRAFGELHDFDPSQAILIAGAALYMHGLKKVLNDVDAVIPEMGDKVEGRINGLEFDLGSGDDFTPEMLQYVEEDGIKYQSREAALAFYKMLNREKDQYWIKCLKDLEKIDQAIVAAAKQFRLKKPSS